jgi:hypothetical protein
MIYGESEALSPEGNLQGKGGVNMIRKNLFLSSVFCAALVYGGVVLAQAPATNIDPNKHGNLAEAQHHILEAYQKIDVAQKDNKDELGGHAEKAKQLLDEASRELKQAADYADQHHH